MPVMSGCTFNRILFMMTNNFILVRSSIIWILFALSLSTGYSQNKDTQQLQRGIMEYFFGIKGTPTDTIPVEDSARVVLELSLDCTNQITRFETHFDTIGEQPRVILSVYGTYVTGPYRPLCPARIVDKDFYIHFPAPGDWIVESHQPPDEKTEPAMIVVR